jgi:methyl-accepting chemotaxis protein
MGIKLVTLRQKLGFAIGVGILLVVAVLVLFSSLQARDEAINAAQNNLKARISALSFEIKQILEDAMDASGALSSSLSVADDYHHKGKLSRETAQAMGEAVLLSKKDFIGLTIAFEPDAFDGSDSRYVNTFAHDHTGRFLSYITRNATGGADIGVLTSYEQKDGAPWYFIPKETKQDFITEPVIYPIQGKDVLMISMMTPILHNGRFLGVTGIDYSIDFMQNLVSNRDIYNGNYDISIISHDGVYAASNTHPDWIYKSVKDVRKDIHQDILKTIQSGKADLINRGDRIIATEPLYVGGSTLPWQIQLTVPVSEITRHANQLMWAQITMGLVFLVIGVVGMIWYVNRLVKPLEAMVVMAEKMADGDLKYRVDIKTTNDEIGNLYHAFSRMRDKLTEIINQIVDGANQIASASEQLSNTSMQISQGAALQASSAEEVSSTIQQITANIQQNRVNAVDSDSITKTVADGIFKGAETSKMSVDAFNDIASRILFIKDIAMQTNILALNASVEAARSGEHGRGFSVVATEVRKLAEHTSEASNLIEELVMGSREVVVETGDIMQSIVPQMEKAQRLVQEISLSSEEQALGANQVNNAIQELSHVIQQNAAASEEMASSSEELSSQAENLKTTIGFFSV